MTPQAFFDKAVGIPYLDKGREYTGSDCYGIVFLAFRDVLGVELPSYAERYVTGADRKDMARLIGGELGNWAEIEGGQERAFDGVLMREGKFPRHIGVITSPGMVLHVQQGETSRIERYRSGALANRVVGFFRYCENETAKTHRQSKDS